MFGLMFKSTHDDEVSFLGQVRESQAAMINKLVAERDTAKTGNTRRDTRIATLETDLAAANEKLRHAEAELKRRDDDTRVAMLAALEQPKPARKPRKTAPKKGAAK